MRSQRVWLTGALGCALIAAGGVSAADLAGRVGLTSQGQPLRASEAAEAVVYFRPDGAFAPPAALPKVEMATRSKEFVPRVLAITPGTEVGFPNLDPIRHNAFSTSAGNIFDTGSYGNGPGTSQVFSKPGLVKVYCNVHHSMSAQILVLDTPHFARPDGTGSFRINGVPDGPGTLVVYHDRATPWQQHFDALPSTPLTIDLELTRRKVPPHMNKFGKPYGRGPVREY